MSSGRSFVPQWHSANEIEKSCGLGILELHSLDVCAAGKVELFGRIQTASRVSAGGAADAMEALQSRLKEAKASGNEQLQNCLGFLLQELATMSLKDMSSVEDLVRKKVKKGKQKISDIVGIVGGDPKDLRDSRLDLMKFYDLEVDVLEDEAKRVCGSISHDCMQPDPEEKTSKVAIPRTVDEFVKAASFSENIQNGGTYFLYYAGHGFEVNGSFYFVPGKPQTIQSCVQLNDVVDMFKNFYGCTFIICINSCRNGLCGAFKDSLRDPFLNKPGQCASFNSYVLMFPTASGIPSDHEGNAVTFAQIVQKFVPRLTDGEDITAVFEDFACEFKKSEQDNPALYYFPSALAKPPTTGYTLLWDLWLRSQQAMQETLSDGSIQVVDHRTDHRRRVNRMTAPTAELPSPHKRPPVCVILGHTRGSSSADYIARFITSGMSANYLIGAEGQRYVLVEEELMAWDYNLAYWGGSGFVTGEGFLESKGKINELKTYSISVALELRRHHDYTDAQYKALVALMRDVRKRWTLEPWNVLGADEVEASNQNKLT